MPEITKEIGADAEIYRRCFDDVYGYRAMGEGFGRHLYYLSPWEFVMLWAIRQLPKPGAGSAGRHKGVCLSIAVGDNDFGPNPEAESDDIIFFPDGIPGPAKLRSRWYLQRRRRPMVPAPNRTRLPDQERDPEKKSMLFSLYMRPWTLHAG